METPDFGIFSKGPNSQQVQRFNPVRNINRAERRPLHFYLSPHRS